MSRHLILSPQSLMKRHKCLECGEIFAFISEPIMSKAFALGIVEWEYDIAGHELDHANQRIEEILNDSSN